MTRKNEYADKKEGENMKQKRRRKKKKKMRTET